MGGTPKSSILNGFSLINIYKPSIFGYSHSPYVSSYLHHGEII